jgi:hypothetical protein
MRRSSASLTAIFAALLLAGCEPDEARYARLQAAAAAAASEVLAAEQALRIYDGADRLEELEARYDTEMQRMEAREITNEGLDDWRALMDSLRVEIDKIRAAPLNLEGPTQDTLLVRLRSNYYAAQDRHTLARLALSFADDR